MSKYIKYDYTFMTSEFVSKHGVSEEEINSIQPRIRTILKNLSIKKLGILDINAIKEITEASLKYRERFENLVVVGIGGSDLGARALHKALNHSHYNRMEARYGDRPKLYFLGNSTDPNEIHELFQIINPKKTLFNIVSKSGETVETLSFFVYIRNLIKNQIGKNFHQNIILTTGNKGTLSKFAVNEGYFTWRIPEDVSGRYSVLTAVGLFPAAMVGIDVRELVEGAESFDINKASTFAAYQYLGYRKGKHISVLMPYSVRLSGISKWFRQLWAESLGKNGIGPTPVIANGPEDQHSQLQLYQEGPHNKLITFIKVMRFGEDYHIPILTDKTIPKNIRYLNKKSFSEIINTEHKATAVSLMKAQRPNGTIIIPEVKEHTVGQLIAFFELSSVIVGRLLEIDPFSQHGVEESKNIIYAELGKEGFDKKREELRGLETNIGKYTI